MESVYKRFGAELRRIRKGVGLTIKESASATREVAPDSSAHISAPYLTQIENGRKVALSYAKLTTLASVYGVTDSELINLAPDGDRPRLKDERHDWMVEGWMPPRKRKPRGWADVDRRLDELIARRAKEVSIPIRRQDYAKQFIRETLVCASLPPFMAVEVEFFVKAKADTIAQFVGQPSDPWIWRALVADYMEFVLYELLMGERAIQAIVAWHVDFPSELATCAFADPGIQRQYGFDRVPALVVQAAREAEIANAIYDLIHTLHPGLLRPDSSVEAGARAYFAEMLNPGCEFCATAPVMVGAVVQAVSDVRRRLLKSSVGKLDSKLHDAIVRFLRSAGRRPRAIERAAKPT